ncbi:CFEM domain-containing protein [Colletotrichum tabaci]|uniref:CFEM domain-containing protein n=1 Tax=Colletotrichum tabaci TaxID=1209068 RepID=A0AAV9T9N9_9PEZI
MTICYQSTARFDTTRIKPCAFCACATANNTIAAPLANFSAAFAPGKHCRIKSGQRAQPSGFVCCN